MNVTLSFNQEKNDNETKLEKEWWIPTILKHNYLIIIGVILLKKMGKPKSDRNEKSLYQFEKTTELIEQGIFKYIRHPYLIINKS